MVMRSTLTETESAERGGRGNAGGGRGTLMLAGTLLPAGAVLVACALVASHGNGAYCQGISHTEALHLRLFDRPAGFRVNRLGFSKIGLSVLCGGERLLFLGKRHWRVRTRFRQTNRY